jgi:predicted dienelactone hydrolase
MGNSEVTGEDGAHSPAYKSASDRSTFRSAVSYLFGPGSLKDVKIPIQLWRGSDDDQVLDEWNAALIQQELPKPPEDHARTGAGHYAFLPPCSEALAKQAPQICTDDPKFDRHAFHHDFNREIVAFFKKALSA